MPNTSKEEVALPSPPLTDPNTIGIKIEEVTEHIQKVTIPKIAKELPKIYEARHYKDEKGITHVEILSPLEDLPPSLSLTIEPDGYAEIRRMDYLDQDYSIHDNADKLDIVDHVQNRLFNRMVEEIGAQTISTIAASEMFSVLYHRLHIAASDLVTRLTIPMPKTDIPFDLIAQDADHPQQTTVTAKNTIYKLLSKADDYAHMRHMRIKMPTAKRSKEKRESEQHVDPGIVAALVLHELNALQQAA